MTARRGAGPAVVLDGLCVRYRRQAALEQVSGCFAGGSSTAVVGPNGAGKSTLLAAILGRLAPSAGGVAIRSGGAARAAWLPQRAEIDRRFPLRVFDFVALGDWHRSGAFGGIGSTGAEAVAAALQAVGLAGAERRSIGELSAGQFQRMLFARVLVQDASLILLDEPFNAIDARTTTALLAVIAQWRAEGRTVIAVLHDLEQAREHFAQALLLARCCIAWGPTAEALSPANLALARHQAERWDAGPAVAERRPAGAAA